VAQLPEGLGVPGLALGESLSSSIASLLAWAQLGLNLPPSVYFLALAVMLVGSGLAFAALLRHLGSNRGEASLQNSIVSPQNDVREMDCADPEQAAMCVSSQQTNRLSSVWGHPGLLYVAVGWMSFLENGVLPALLPYAVAQYSTTAYFLSSTVPIAALAALLLLFVKASRPGIASLLMALTLTMGYVTWLSFQGSWVPLGPSVGAGAAVLAVLASKGLLAYTKAAAMYRLQVEASTSEDAKAHLEMAGIMMQVWSLIGSLLMFWLVNYSSWLPNKF